MNALTHRQFTQAVTLADAIAAASLWTLAARPVVQAMFALDDVDWTLAQGCDRSTYGEAKDIIAKPRKQLLELVEGIRDNFLSDQLPPQPSPDAPDSEWDARDEFQAEVEAGVPTVAAFVRQMELEA